jgi:lipopolysaccharide export system protein LptC
VTSDPQSDSKQRRDGAPAPDGAGRGNPRTELWARFMTGRPARKVSRHYSRFVGLMKFALPLIALALAGLVAIWPQLQETGDAPALEPEVAQQSSTEMISPRYFGTDEADRPYSIIGRSARQLGDTGEIIELTEPEAEITLEDGAWMILLADFGRLNQVDSEIYLRGSVNVFRDDGYEFLTDEAFIDLDTRNAWGDMPVEGQGPGAQVVAQGFRIENGGTTVVFTGESRMLLRPGGGETAP